MRFPHFQACFLGLNLLLLIPVSGDPSAGAPQEALIYDGVSSDCHNACTALVATLGSSAHYNPSSTLPGFRESLYSTQQRLVVPACVITPENPQEVAQTISIIRHHSCIFAVKSGGHARSVGDSNAPDGITIDLRKLDTIEVSEDRLTTRVGTGNRWRNVYEKLEPMNLTVVGGRNSDVGVGGFILGGGISFVSRRYGWALDNVRNFEVVLANGTLANINQASSPDLYYALRGGGNNFGIVTNFDLETHPQGPVWGGQNFYLASPSEFSLRKARLNISNPAFSLSPLYLKNRLTNTLIGLACKLNYCVSSKSFFHAIKSIILAEQSDPYAQMYAGLTWASQTDSFVYNSALIYSSPVPSPSIFSSFLSLPTVYSSNSIQPFTKIYEEVAWLNEIGFRQHWQTATFKLSEELLERITDIYTEEVELIKGVRDVIPSMIWQPINRDEIRLFGKNGGNCLGIKGDEGPLLLFSFAFRWSEEKDDLKMKTAGDNILHRSVAVAKEMGLWHRYIYQNYAGPDQDVFGSYGVNRERLRRIQRKYDPEGVFWRLQPGYFKV